MSFCSLLWKKDSERQVTRLKKKWGNLHEGFSLENILSIITPEPQIWTTIDETVDVVIPIYNGLEHLYRLLPLLFTNTTQPHRFIFVNDCSPDVKIREYILKQTAGREDCILLDNERNVGFTATVNRGVGLVKSDVFIILNTDVMVPPMWLERLIAPFRQDKRVGTATPFTNSGSYYSFPNFARDNNLDSVDDFLQTDEAFRHIVVKNPESLEFINGTGFCMAIRKLCWDKFGGLDAESFGKGYGEECDLSYRYLDNGYKNIVVPNLFVYHKHGGSFLQEERKILISEHMRILNERWGKYLDLLPCFVQNDPWAQYRLAALCVLYSDKSVCVLIRTCNNIEESATEDEKAIMAEGKRVITLLFAQDSGQYWLTFPNNDGRALFKMHDICQAHEWQDYFVGQ